MEGLVRLGKRRWRRGAERGWTSL